MTGFKRREDLHLVRKLWHALGIVLMLVIYHNTSEQVSILIVLTCLVVIAPLDILRRFHRPLNKFVIKIFGPFMRQDETHQISGLTFLLLGSLFLLCIYPRPIITLTLLLQAFADPSASLVGLLYGKNKIVGKKSLQGSLGAFVVCLLVSFGFYLSKNIMTDRLVLVSLLTGIMGSISELIPVGRLDDNLTFPVICSGLLWVLFMMFGGL